MEKLSSVELLNRFYELKKMGFNQIEIPSHEQIKNNYEHYRDIYQTNLDIFKRIKECEFILEKYVSYIIMIKYMYENNPILFKHIKDLLDDEIKVKIYLFEIEHISNYLGEQNELNNKSSLEELKLKAIELHNKIAFKDESKSWILDFSKTSFIEIFPDLFDKPESINIIENKLSFTNSGEMICNICNILNTYSNFRLYDLSTFLQ